MDDKILSVTNEVGNMTIVLKDGKRIPVKAKTSYVTWTSGRKDCNVSIEEPIDSSSQSQI